MPLPSQSCARALRILIVSDAPPGALRAELAQAGHQVVCTLPADLLMADAVTSVAAALERIDSAGRGQRLPTVLFTEDQSASSMEAAMAAGVSAYIVGARAARRMETVIGLALARFAHDQKLLAELESSRTRLAERKVIERAKGLLMASARLTEDQAYQKLRGMAMNKNMKLAEIAQRILDVEDLLG